MSDEPEAEGRGDTTEVLRGGVEEGSENESYQEKSEEEDEVQSEDEVHDHHVDVELVCVCRLGVCVLPSSTMIKTVNSAILSPKPQTLNPMNPNPQTLHRAYQDNDQGFRA